MVKVNLLKAKMAAAEMTVDDLLENLKKHDVTMSKSTYYKKVNGISEFSIGELNAIAHSLKMTSLDVLNTFFGKCGELT